MVSVLNWEVFILDLETGKKIFEKIKPLFTDYDVIKNLIPDSILVGSDEHLHFITLVSLIGYADDLYKVVEAANMTYEDPNTRYLFYPEEVVLVADNDFRKYAYDMKKYKLVKRVLNDVAHWYELCRVIVSEHDGKLLGLFIDSEYDAHVIYQKLKNDKWEYTKGHFLPKYMVLGDDKIYPMWFILLKSCGIPLRNLEKVPMPITDEIIRLFNITGITESSDSAVVSEL